MGYDYDYIIVGAGCAGGTLAKELSSKTDKKILLIEKGKNENCIGGFKNAFFYFDKPKFSPLPRKSKEGVILYRTIMAGGSTMVACANATRSLEKEFANLGINLQEEFEETEKELEVRPTNERLLSDGSRFLRDKASKLGYNFKLTPKYLKKCRKCGLCSTGCGYKARWTAVDSVEIAKASGVDVVYNTPIHEVVVSNGRAIGVKGEKKHEHFQKSGEKIILSAGGLGTPVILQNSGIKDAGKNLFMDLFVNVYGISKQYNLANEPQMAIYMDDFHEDEGFILASYVNNSAMVRFMEFGIKGLFMPTQKLLGFMVKISDDASGIVSGQKVSKGVTNQDQRKLDKGIDIAKNILKEAGIKKSKIHVSKVQGAHPGGTAAMGMIVDNSFETKIENLYVCDTSIFPKTPGLPPILTTLALAKKCSQKLVD